MRSINTAHYGQGRIGRDLRAPSELLGIDTVAGPHNVNEPLHIGSPLGMLKQPSGDMQLVALGVLRASDQYTIW